MMSGWQPTKVQCGSWSGTARFYADVHCPSPALTSIRRLCEHVTNAPYCDLVFCATSMHTLLVGQHPALEWNCNMLRIETAGDELITFTFFEQPFVEPVQFSCAPASVIEAFEKFLLRTKWVTAFPSP